MANEAQIALWNGSASEGWVNSQKILDQLFLPFEELLVAALEPTDQDILDVGCGTGATILAVARSLRAGETCLGVDVSQPMIALARDRAEREGSIAQFLVADAQLHDFGSQQFDAVISRFGVMFFDDPVTAFRNLRKATRQGGRLHCLTFRNALENAFMTAAERPAGCWKRERPKGALALQIKCAWVI